MPDTPSAELVQLLERHHQQHLLAWWDDLDAVARRRLVGQIESVDFGQIERLCAVAEEVDADDTPEARARRAGPPRDLIRLPDSPEDQAERDEAARRGEGLLADGKVGIILVAGGQGTRLGFDHPKGQFPIGPVSDHSLFQLLVEQALARSRRAGRAIPYYVMTSDATHEETIAFFARHRHFGLDPAEVRFFRQGNMPAVDAATGRLLLAEKGRLAFSPDGHGGMLDALLKERLLDDMGDRGVEHLYYHQVDNPTAVVCDPSFLGYHAERGSEISTKVVAKRTADEPMGVVAEIDGMTQIVEYSDMPDDVAELSDGSGGLLHWAGNTAVHIFNRTFFERLAADRQSLPFHRAFKKVESIDEAGILRKPDEPNAYKFERFIFDALNRTKRALVVEAERAAEFNPVKNAKGNDSPETAQQGMSELYRSWLRRAGARVPDDAVVEISPLFALDAEELCDKLTPGTEFGSKVYLCE